MVRASSSESWMASPETTRLAAGRLGSGAIDTTRAPLAGGAASVVADISGAGDGAGGGSGAARAERSGEGPRWGARRLRRRRHLRGRRRRRGGFLRHRDEGRERHGQGDGG